MDHLVRACLVVIALALAVGAARDLEWIGDSPAEPASFRLMPIPQGRIILMQDIRTGETWRTNLKNPNKWVRIEHGPGHQDGDDEPAGVSQGSEDS